MHVNKFFFFVKKKKTMSCEENSMFIYIGDSIPIMFMYSSKHAYTKSNCMYSSHFYNEILFTCM
jgi:hypothetical protein